MKKLFFICGLLTIACNSYGQVNTEPQNFEDSLTLAKHLIDQLNESDLTKQRERFIYLNRNQPSKINSEVLLYIEEKYKTINR